MHGENVEGMFGIFKGRLLGAAVQVAGMEEVKAGRGKGTVWRMDEVRRAVRQETEAYA